MMGIEPHRPIKDIERALSDGDLLLAAAIARDFARERKHPIPLDLAVRFLPVAARDHTAYDAYACRWLSRWLRESHAPSIDTAAEIAGCLADLPAEPSRLEGILRLLRG